LVWLAPVAQVKSPGLPRSGRMRSGASGLMVQDLLQTET